MVNSSVLPHLVALLYTSVLPQLWWMWLSANIITLNMGGIIKEAWEYHLVCRQVNFSPLNKRDSPKRHCCVFLGHHDDSSRSCNCASSCCCNWTACSQRQTPRHWSLKLTSFRPQLCSVQSVSQGLSGSSLQQVCSPFYRWWDDDCWNEIFSDSYFDFLYADSAPDSLPWHFKFHNV